MESLIDKFSVKPKAKAPLNVSPAPVVSTTLAFMAGIFEESLHRGK